MLQVEVDRVQNVSYGVRNPAPCPIPINLQRYVGVGGQRMRPSADQVLAFDGDVARPSLRDFASIEITLESGSCAVSW